jgi:hypothetical protein
MEQYCLLTAVSGMDTIAICSDGPRQEVSFGRKKLAAIVQEMSL